MTQPVCVHYMLVSLKLYIMYLKIECYPSNVCKNEGGFRLLVRNSKLKMPNGDQLSSGQTGYQISQILFTSLPLGCCIILGMSFILFVP